jgi:hypothetical protein
MTAMALPGGIGGISTDEGDQIGAGSVSVASVPAARSGCATHDCS